MTIAHTITYPDVYVYVYDLRGISQGKKNKKIKIKLNRLTINQQATIIIVTVNFVTLVNIDHPSPASLDLTFHLASLHSA